MRFLVIGYGSIGKRHAGNVKKIGHEAVLLRHAGSAPNTDQFREFFSFKDAINSGIKFDGAIVCSPTAQHSADVSLLIEHNIPFLLEKPPAKDLKSTAVIAELLNNTGFTKYDVAYNMRYYPPVKFIKDYLPKLGKIYSVRISADYYLPNWRPQVDYRKTSSALKELGGGVHTEMVHEIDYMYWYFGMPDKVAAIIDKVSSLEISTDDLCTAIFRYNTAPVVELHLGYLSKKYSRGSQIIAENGTLEWDFKNGQVLFTDSCATKCLMQMDKDYDFNDTYIQELNNFIGVINETANTRVSAADAVNVMKIVNAMETAATSGKFISIQ